MLAFSSKSLPFLSALPLVTSLCVFFYGADSYKLYTVAETQSENFVMGDDFGNYAFHSSMAIGHTNLCGTSYLDLCYEVGNVFTGASYYSSSVPAPLSDPNASSGHTDLPAGPGWHVDKSLGNLFEGSYQAPNGLLKFGIWDGPDPVAGYLGQGSIDGGLSSANGNVFYIDGYNNTLVVGIDLQTSPVPEPGTLSLTASALVAAAGFGWRRLQR